MEGKILKGNKLIAEFMGWKFYPEHTLNGIKGVLKKKGKSSLHLDETKLFHVTYHKSWDALMPAIRKVMINTVNPSGEYAVILENINGNLTGGLCRCDLSECYRVVVDYIQWHFPTTPITKPI